MYLDNRKRQTCTFLPAVTLLLYVIVRCPQKPDMAKRCLRSKECSLPRFILFTFLPHLHTSGIKTGD